MSPSFAFLLTGGFIQVYKRKRNFYAFLTFDFLQVQALKIGEKLTFYATNTKSTSYEVLFLCSPVGIEPSDRLQSKLRWFRFAPVRVVCRKAALRRLRLLSSHLIGHRLIKQ
jgi:hypothetical protein